MDSKMVGAFIAICRRENGWTQSEFAKNLNVSNKAVSKWETGRGLPDVSMFPVIAMVLDVTVAELMQGYKDVEDDKHELIVISDMDTAELISSMSKTQQKTIKKTILKSFFACCITITAKLLSVASVVAIIAVFILFGTGVISINGIKITPNQEDFECLFFAKSKELPKEYYLNGKISLSFDFAIRNKNGAHYSVYKPVVDVKEIIWYRSNIFYYTIKYNDSEEISVVGGTTVRNNAFLISPNYNYINNTINLNMAGTYVIAGYSEFIINDKTFKYSDSITIKVNQIEDKLIGDYVDVPKFMTNGHFTTNNNIVYWGEEIANNTKFSHTTLEEQKVYETLLINKGYSYRQVVKEDERMQIYENGEYKIYLLFDNQKPHVFYRYVVTKE